MTSEIEHDLQGLQQDIQKLLDSVKENYTSSVNWLADFQRESINELKQTTQAFEQKSFPLEKNSRKRQTRRNAKDRPPLQPIVNNTDTPRETRAQRRKRVANKGASPSLQTPQVVPTIQKTTRIRTRRQKQLDSSPQHSTSSKLSVRDLLAHDARYFEQSSEVDAQETEPIKQEPKPSATSRKRTTRKTKKKAEQTSKKTKLAVVSDVISISSTEHSNLLQLNKENLASNNQQDTSKPSIPNDTDNEVLQEDCNSSSPKRDSHPVTAKEDETVSRADNAEATSPNTIEPVRNKISQSATRSKKRSAEETYEQDASEVNNDEEITAETNDDDQEISSKYAPLSSDLRERNDTDSEKETSEPKDNVGESPVQTIRTRTRSHKQATHNTKSVAKKATGKKKGGTRKKRKLRSTSSEEFYPSDKEMPPHENETAVPVSTTKTTNNICSSPNPTLDALLQDSKGAIKEKTPVPSPDSQSTKHERADRQTVPSPAPRGSAGTTEDDSPVIKRKRMKPASSLTKPTIEDGDDAGTSSNDDSDFKSPHSEDEDEQSDANDDPDFATPNERLSGKTSEEELAPDEGDDANKDDDADVAMMSTSDAVLPAQEMKSVPEQKSISRVSDPVKGMSKSTMKGTKHIVKDEHCSDEENGRSVSPSPTKPVEEKADAKPALTGKASKSDSKEVPKASSPHNFNRFAIDANGRVTNDSLGLLSQIVSAPTSSSHDGDGKEVLEEQRPSKSTRSGKLFKPTQPIYSSNRKAMTGGKQIIQRSKDTGKGNKPAHTPGARAPLSFITEANQQPTTKPRNALSSSTNILNHDTAAPSRPILQQVNRDLPLKAATKKNSLERIVKRNADEEETIKKDSVPSSSKRMVSFKVALEERINKNKKKVQMNIEPDMDRDSLEWIAPKHFDVPQENTLEPKTAPVNKKTGIIEPQSSARPKSALRCRIEAFREGKVANAVIENTSATTTLPATKDNAAQENHSSNSLLPSSFSIGRIKSPTSFSHVPKAIQPLPKSFTKPTLQKNDTDEQLVDNDRFDNQQEDVQHDNIEVSVDCSQITPEDNPAAQRTERSSSASTKPQSADPTPNNDENEIIENDSSVKEMAVASKFTPDPSSSGPRAMISNLAGSVKSFLPTASSFFAPRTAEKRRSSSDPEVIAKRQKLDVERREAELATKREAQRIAKHEQAIDRQRKAEARRKLLADAERHKEEERRLREVRRQEKRKEEEKERRRQKEIEGKKKEERRKQILLKHKAIKADMKRLKKNMEKGQGSSHKKEVSIADEDDNEIFECDSNEVDKYNLQSPPTRDNGNRKARGSSAGPSSYVITPARETSDMELSEEEEERRKDKVIPNWAKTPRLVSTVENQPDPDEFFVNVPKCNLEDIFGRRKRYTRIRSSSGNWTRDRITAKEAMAYRKYLEDEKDEQQ